MSVDAILLDGIEIERRELFSNGNFREKNLETLCRCGKHGY